MKYRDWTIEDTGTAGPFRFRATGPSGEFLHAGTVARAEALVDAQPRLKLQGAANAALAEANRLREKADRDVYGWGDARVYEVDNVPGSRVLDESDGRVLTAVHGLLAEAIRKRLDAAEDDPVTIAVTKEYVTCGEGTCDWEDLSDVIIYCGGHEVRLDPAGSATGLKPLLNWLGEE